MRSVLVWLACTTSVAALAAGEPAAVDGDDRPNIVFLLSDDLAHDALSCAGHPFLETPALDRLAREGVRYANAFATTSLCCPARMSFLTGQWARRHGVVTNIARAQPIATFATLLADAGYDTGYFGKWHVLLGGGMRDLPGFGTVATYEGQGRYNDCAFVVDGRPRPTQGFVDDVSTDFALEFLRRDRDGPFLLALGFKGTHGPYRPAARHADAFAELAIEPPANAADLPPYPLRSEHRELARDARVHEVQFDPEDDWAQGRDRQGAIATWNPERVRKYARIALSVDDNVGRVLAALDELELADDTLVVFASDNGFGLGHHGGFGKRNAYDESMRITLLARWPGRLAAGQTRSELALNVDVAPTFLAAAGVDVPAEVQGQSLLELEASRPWRRAFVYEYYWEPDARPNVTSILALRTERHKLVTYRGHAGWSAERSRAGRRCCG